MHQTNDELDLEQKLFIHIMGASENPLYLIPGTMENCSVKRPYCSRLCLTIKTRLMCMCVYMYIYCIYIRIYIYM